MPIAQTNGINMHYEERGTGEPLILLMGLGADGSVWEEHVKAYEKHFRCILIDNRGSGRSDKPEGPYSTKMMAEDTAGLMKALGIKKAHVSGISMGSAIAQELALAYPETVTSLILNCPWDQCDNYTTRVFESFKSLVGTVDVQTFTRNLQLWIFTPSYHNDNLEDLLAREESGKSNPYPMPAHAFQAQCDACTSHNTVGRLSQISVPTLVTVGDKDIFTPLHYSERIAKEIPGAQLLVYEGSGHTHHWDRLQDYNRETLDFLLQHQN
ncbi:alpha/beta fold hydrolase [Paenibacillus abyssi]|uniref:Alpha/beta hydrolase fold protein n=1 Tax=Paenibacillus abyssi TaxID=1340531 RepID=A0A917G0L2_9BACL|nr:alpha/beta fold hydrolase [Paenibacillus abyssi]GGG16747.1 alpha/beta hydrolase fold protein [Paenibacillus abyssi]